MQNELDHPDRYHRQRLLGQIGREGENRLRQARILLIGCGALGSNLAELLVRAGIGFLRLVDRDLVELTNLQRQVLFDEEDARQELPKSIAAARRLAKINSSVRIDPLVADFHAGNAASLAGIESQPVDLILDGTDNVATRYLINDLSVKYSIPWVHGACIGMEGRVLGVWPGKTACLRCIYPEPPPASELPTCDTAGVLNAAAAATAAMQAAVAMRFLVEGSPGSGGGALLTLDVWKSQFRSIAAPVQADCSCCQGRQFPFFSTAAADFTTTLCGRRAIQVQSASPVGPEGFDLKMAAVRLRQAGSVSQSAYFLRCRLQDPPGIELTLFPDGRLLVHGMTDLGRARSIYARFIGT
jgi:molybdopterin-synthase adenylyltransferase